MKKISRAKLKKGWQVYNAIMSNFWLLITFCLVGFIIGYFVNKANPTENNVWLLVFSIIGFGIGIINFFFRLILDLIKLNNTETKEIKQMVQENPNVFNKIEDENSEDVLEQTIESIKDENDEN